MLKNGGRGRKGTTRSEYSEVRRFNKLRNHHVLYVRVQDEGASEDLQQIKRILDGYRGDFEAVLVMVAQSKLLSFPNGWEQSRNDSRAE